MATAVTIRPDDPRTAAFRWLVSTLQADPLLRRHVRQWQVWDGSPQSDDPPATAGTVVRLTPTYEAEEAVATLGAGRVSVRCPVLVQIEVRTVGSHVDNSINLAGLIEGAAWPNTPGERVAMHAACVSWIEWSEAPAIAGDNVTATGSVRLVVHINRG